MGGGAGAGRGIIPKSIVVQEIGQCNFFLGCSWLLSTLKSGYIFSFPRVLWLTLSYPTATFNLTSTKLHVT